MALGGSEASLQVYSAYVSLDLDGDELLAIFYTRYHTANLNSPLTIKAIISEAALVNCSLGKRDGSSPFPHAALVRALVALLVREHCDTTTIK